LAECSTDHVRPIGIELMHLHVRVRVNKHEKQPPSPRHTRRDASLRACRTTEYRGHALPLSNMKLWQNSLGTTANLMHTFRMAEAPLEFVLAHHTSSTAWV
ncbi:MAG TPA: hypothetical protein VF510_04385, partial [Ktedonobacterales bacterium]